MLSRTPLRLALGVAAVALASLATPPAAGQAKKATTKTITIPTFDGVSLAGTMYPNPGGKREAVVVLLHSFDHKKGGSSQAEGWSDLAAALQADGYSVLAFDFRGFGDSKNVKKDTFWNHKHNATLKAKKKGDTIDHTMFTAAYYPYLVNDVAAVRAYLDRRNDAKELNSGNIILIGAGDGAAVGQAWLAHEARRRREKGGGLGGAKLSDESEVKDVAAAIWLSITPNVGSKTTGVGARLPLWVYDSGKTNKVPTLFLVGKNDTKGDDLSGKLLAKLKPMGAKGKDLPHTIVEKIPETNLQGVALLDKNLGTINYIVKTYLPKVLEDRGAREWNERESNKTRFWYTVSAASNKPLKLNQAEKVDVGPVDIGLLFPSSP